MMIRYLNALAIIALVGAAMYAYSIKYATIYYAEQIVKMKHEMEREHDAIAVLQAEWSHLIRPERIQALADQHLPLQPQALSQIVRPSDLPEQQVKVDMIGRKLEALGLSEPTSTPIDTTLPDNGSTPSTPH
jgi:cell division protein FtsL